MYLILLLNQFMKHNKSVIYGIMLNLFFSLFKDIIEKTIYCGRII